MRGSNNAISIVNFTDRKIDYFLQGQILTSSATELIGISNSPSTNIEYLKKVAGENHLYLSQKYADNLIKKFWFVLFRSRELMTVIRSTLLFTR
jgi:hypothetical protein